MAFAKQYFSSYKSNNNLDYYLEIWVDGYTGGNPTEIKLGAGGPVISYDTDQEDRFSPILSSQCELPFMVTGVGTEFFIRQLREVYKDKQVYLHLYRATSSTYTTEKPMWSGFLIMDLGSGEDVSFPYEQKLKFVDGLSLLKDIDFVDLSSTDTPAGSTIPLNERTQGNYDKLNMYYGPAVYTFWIKEILKKVGAAITGVNGQGVTLNYGFTTAVNWYNGKMQNTNQASDPLGLTKCVVTMFHEKNDQEVFTPENCYVVLKELLRHWGARITYWQHEFWIVQIPEYITTESGTLDNPDNINSRQYNLSGSLLGSQDHLGDTYYTRYEQTIQTDKVSKIVGTQYNYLPMINNVDAEFLSFASNNYYGGFPFGNSAVNQEIYQGTITDPSTADFLFLSIPLDWVWDMGSSALVNGHTNGWHCQVRFNFFASQLLNGTVTTYYLQYNSNGTYYWVTEADWRPLGVESPNYKIKSRQLVESNYVGFEEQIPFVDGAGNPISMLGGWDFFLDIEKYGTTGSNPGSFICNLAGYGFQIRKFNPQLTSPNIPAPSGGLTSSGTVSWSNTLEIPGTTNFTILPLSQLGFNAGTSTLDIRLITSSPFRGVLQALNTTAAATFGITLNTLLNNNTNTERYSFGTLLWGDAVQSFAIGALRVNTGTAFVKTDANGEWGRGTLTGDKTFTELLIHEFLSGQLEVVISPSMRLVVGDSNKNVTISNVTRPRFVNPIGILRETRNGPDPVYFFRRGSFYSLYDEWDYEGYQIIRDTVSSSTTTNNIGDLGGSQDSNPVSSAKLIGNVTDALSTNSTIASLRQTVASTGANVVVNGNFNVATGWVLGTGWSIDTTASKAKFAATGSLSSLSQINLTEGTKYQIIFTIDITAGQLTVKAGNSGGSQVITVAGQYELYLLCEGSTSIQFQAGTTFTGSISQVSIADQKSLSSVPIESLGETVFKTNDTFNLINSINGEVIPLTVTSNQGATDTAISVTAVPLFDDIGIDSVLLINQDDLSAQYQNKTKGTVAGFGIDADGISKGGIEITGWLNSDTMTGAAVTNVPTALSVKNYVDGQVGANDTLQEVTDNGNTTTNSIMIGSSSSPSEKLHITGGGSGNLRLDSGGTYYGTFLQAISSLGIKIGNDDYSAFTQIHNDGYQLWNMGGSERMRLNSTGLGIGTSSPTTKLEIAGTGNQKLLINRTDGDNFFIDAQNGQIRLRGSDNIYIGISGDLLSITNTAIGIGTNSPTEKLHVVGKGIFTDQVTIPATPVANTDAASKSYVDAHGGGVGPFLPLTGGTLTGGLTGTTANFNGLIKSFDGSVYSQFNASGQDTIIVNSGTGNIRIFNGGSERARITSGGNFGIGDIPSFKLDVNVTNSRARFKSTTGDVNIELSSIPGHDWLIKSNSDDSFVIYDEDAATERLRITSGGNLLLGTTTDSAKLVVKIGSANNVIQRWETTNGLAGLLQTSGDFSEFILSQPGGNPFIVLNTNGNSYFNGGNVGIGISSPTSIMHISKAGGVVVKLGTSQNTSEIEAREVGGANSLVFSSNNSADNLVIDGGGNTTLSGLLTGTSATFSAASSGDVYFTGGTNNLRFLKFSTFDTVSANAGHKLDATSGNGQFAFAIGGNEKMRLTSGGNLGVGTTSPEEKISVSGSVQLANQQELTWADIGDGNTGRVAIRGNEDNDFIMFKTDNSERMRLTNTGLGIGTSSPAYKLDTTGNIRATGNVYANDSLVTNTIVSVGSQDLGIVKTGAFSITFLTNGSEKARITSAGNFLINSTSDDGVNKLQVNGRIKTSNDGIIIGDSNRRLVNNSNNLELRTYANFSITVAPNNSESTRFLPNGNVLIGTTTDNGAKLKITTSESATTSTSLYLENTGSGGGEGVSIVFNPMFGATSMIASNREGANSGLTNLSFHTCVVNDNPPIERMRLTSGGNLLISTTTDNGDKLQIGVANSAPGFATDPNVATTIASITNGDEVALQLFVNDGTNNIRSKFFVDDTELIAGFDVTYSSGLNGFVFKMIGSEKMRLSTNGNFLINSTSDNGQKLQVTGNIRITGGFQTSNTGGFLLADTGGSMRYGLKYGAAGAVGSSNLLMLTNRSLSTATGGGEVAISANASTSGVTETEVMRIKANTQSQVSIDGVLSLTSQNTPADPPNRASTIWLDSNFDLKIKITNNSGVTVTKTIVEYA